MDNDAVRTALVAFMIAVRDASPLRMWDQCQSRLRVAAMTTGDVPAFATRFARGMQAEVRSSVSSATTALVDAVGAEHRACLSLVSREHAYVIALAQLATEKRIAAAKARKEERRAVALEGDVADWPMDKLTVELDAARERGDADMVSAIEAEIPKRGEANV